MTEAPSSATPKDGQTRGLVKVAILLMSMRDDAAAKILELLPQETVEEVTREIASLDLVDSVTQGKVVEEFYHLAVARQHAQQGGLNYAKGLLQKALNSEDASRIIQQIASQIYQQPFSFLNKTDGGNLLAFIQEEHPQTIALILSFMQPSRASEVLTGLAHEKQLEVVSRIANMEQTNPEVVREVERGLEMRLSGLMSQKFERVGGVESVAEILNLADRSTEKSILEAMEGEDPDLVDQIRRLMFVFEDILLVNDKGIQSVLKEVDNEELSLSLKTASPELRDKIFRNMSERAVQLIKEDMEYMGPVRVSDVEGAQQKIVDIVRRLEDAGEIIISGRGGEKEMIIS